MELINGDCLEKMKDLSDNSVDIVIADLPYGRFVHLGGKDGWDNPINLEKLWKQIWRVCKKTAPVFMFGDMKFGVELINSCPRHFKYEIVWDKKMTTTPLLSKKRLGKATEYIFIFYKKQPVYNFEEYHKKLIKPIQDLNVKNKKTRRPGGVQSYCYNEWGKSGKQYDPKLPTNVVQSNLIIGKDDMYHSKSAVYEPVLPTNVLNEYPVRNNKLIKNITEKPQFILEFLLKYFSNKGDTCLDMTMGSGSCGVACKTLERKFIGIELNKKHYDIAKNRLL
jgi:site-specific DNA-methyltransferase (adenine-specific)